MRVKKQAFGWRLSMVLYMKMSGAQRSNGQMTFERDGCGGGGWGESE